MVLERVLLERVLLERVVLEVCVVFGPAVVALSARVGRTSLIAGDQVRQRNAVVVGLRGWLGQGSASSSTVKAAPWDRFALT
ncbi:hypothetical protein [Streptomyces sp. NPDC001970]